MAVGEGGGGLGFRMMRCRGMKSRGIVIVMLRWGSCWWFDELWIRGDGKVHGEMVRVMFVSVMGGLGRKMDGRRAVGWRWLVVE